MGGEGNKREPLDLVVACCKGKQHAIYIYIYNINLFLFMNFVNLYFNYKGRLCSIGKIKSKQDVFIVQKN